jgi:hypothetical protein
VFRRDLDVKKVYLTLAALGYFYLSNRYTLSSFLGIDLMRPSECDAWLARSGACHGGGVRARAARSEELKALHGGLRR